MIRNSVLSQAKEMTLTLPKESDVVYPDVSQIESALLAPRQLIKNEPGESSLERIKMDVDAKPKDEPEPRNLEEEALKLDNMKKKLQNIQQQQNVPNTYIKQDVFELIDLKASPTGSFEGRQSPMYNNKLPKGQKLNLPSFSKLKLGDQGSDPIGRFKNFSKRAYKNLMQEDSDSKSKEGGRRPLNIRIESNKATDPPSNEPTFEPIINIQALRTSPPTKSPSPSMSQSKKHMANQIVKLGGNTKKLEIKTFYSTNTKEVDTQTRQGKNDILLEGILHTMKTTQSPTQYGKPKIIKKPIVIETQINGSAIRELSKNSSFELTGSLSKFHQENSLQESKPNLKEPDISSFLDMTITIKIE